MNSGNEPKKGKQSAFQPFIEANWLHNTKEFGATLDNQTMHQAGAANIVEIKAGAEGKINNRLNLWGNVSQQVGNNGYSDTGFMLGVKYHF
ncbi:type V secretion protein A [Serratia sp. S1B]|nr:type V secretion protein A [Serratia sp. S1B]